LTSYCERVRVPRHMVAKFLRAGRVRVLTSQVDDVLRLAALQNPLG
jgi:predicted site-specific integrase-resolvase